jgi:uncharacterized membrane protein YeiH
MVGSLSFFIDVIGTIAFAVSGAMLAVRKRMDIFGVCILAVTTATGGGVVRDLLIGKNPPVMFRDPVYVVIAVITSAIVVLSLHFQKQERKKYIAVLNEKLLFICDTLGLAAFTVNGVSTGMYAMGYKNLFLVTFLGVVTGVGGGVMRDIFAREMPEIFVKHIYACAAIVGAFLTGILWDRIGENGAMSIGFAAVVLIRILAAYYHWNLPRIDKYQSAGKQ